MKQYHFEASHTVETVGLTLFDSADCVVWHVDVARFEAQTFVDALYRGFTPDVVCLKEFTLALLVDKYGVVIMISDSGWYLKFKVLLTKKQAKELASVIQSHIIASEMDGRPKDLLQPLDDTLSGGYSPDKERDLYHPDQGEEEDPADDWKKGKGPRA